MGAQEYLSISDITEILRYWNTSHNWNIEISEMHPLYYTGKPHDWKSQDYSIASDFMAHSLIVGLISICKSQGFVFFF